MVLLYSIITNKYYQNRSLEFQHRGLGKLVDWLSQWVCGVLIPETRTIFPSLKISEGWNLY